MGNEIPDGSFTAEVMAAVMTSFPEAEQVRLLSEGRTWWDGALFGLAKTSVLLEARVLQREEIKIYTRATARPRWHLGYVSDMVERRCPSDPNYMAPYIAKLGRECTASHFTWVLRRAVDVAPGAVEEAMSEFSRQDSSVSHRALELCRAVIGHDAQPWARDLVRLHQAVFTANGAEPVPSEVHEAFSTCLLAWDLWVQGSASRIVSDGAGFLDVLSVEYTQMCDAYIEAAGSRHWYPSWFVLARMDEKCREAAAEIPLSQLTNYGGSWQVRRERALWAMLAHSLANDLGQPDRWLTACNALGKGDTVGDLMGLAATL